MARTKRGMLIASILVLASVLLSACNQPYSQAPAVTNTPITQSNLFASAQPTDMGAVQALATGSAIAAQMTTSPGVPVVVSTATLAPGVTPLAVTATSTPLVALPATSTLAVVAQTAAPAIPAGTRPTEYYLKEGEWPYCIARRFDVNPDTMLQASGLVSPDLYYAGLKLVIPQSGSFPGPRVLVSHPTTYIVSTGDTLDTIACNFGDLYPDTIAQANGLSANSTLTSGQTLKIP